ncbi:MAG: LamG domain-containing protein [Ignavibacteriales bacterium]|nr:LamG domain-containing protein [Ignavibacteriales bacterium]
MSLHIDFFIGKNHNGNFFQGSLDDMRIFNRLLNGNEILELHDDSTTYFPPAIDSLVAYFAFNGNVNDESGNMNNGINHNASFAMDRYGIDNASLFPNWC